METPSVDCDTSAHRLQKGEAASTSPKAVSGSVCLPPTPELRNRQDSTGIPKVQDPDHTTSMPPRWQGILGKTL